MLDSQPHCRICKKAFRETKSKWTALRTGGCQGTLNCERMLDAAETGGISADERLAIERNQGSSRGIASAVVAVSEPVLASATAVAALSCEALRAQVLLFDGLERFCLMNVSSFPNLTFQNPR